MTSVQRETDRAERLDCVRKRVALGLAQALGARQRLVTRQALERALDAVPSTVG
jgi:lipoyl(octanoyl) transferase